MAQFLIEYTDPQTGEEKQVAAEFTDGNGVSAREWAEDYAYTLADKGRYTVKEVAA
jgi:hypothetical protein